MNYELLYDKMFMYKCRLTAASREYHGYVKKAAWSDDICHRVDKLKAVIEECETEITAIEELMAYDPYDSYDPYDDY